MSHWTHLVRFVASQDLKVYAGQLVETSPSALNSLGRGTEAYVIQGDPLGEYVLTKDKRTVERLLCPVAKEQVPIVRCVGLNYASHVQEGKQNAPTWPTLFVKPRTSLADPDTSTPVPKCAQDKTLDYEAELCFVISKDCRDVPMSADWDLEDLVAGYLCGNDLSWRRGQLEPQLGGSQWCLGKGLDAFAPLGPVLVSPTAVDPSDLAIALRVNGATKQSSRTSKMVHKVRDIISRFSQGTTLERGTVIMSGTPEGVGFFQSPQVYLADGDAVEVEIEGLGVLRHGIKYE